MNMKKKTDSMQPGETVSFRSWIQGCGGKHKADNREMIMAFLGITDETGLVDLCDLEGREEFDLSMSDRHEGGNRDGRGI